jgi:hypothetical protein
LKIEKDFRPLLLEAEKEPRCNLATSAGDEPDYSQYLQLLGSGGAACLACGATFTHSTNARRHVRTAHQGTRQACHHCGKWFKNERTYKLHWKSCNRAVLQ